MNVALQLYSVRKSLKEDFWGTMRAVRAMGYTGVEGYGMPCTAQEFKAALDSTGLQIVGWHQAIDGLAPDKLPLTVSYHKAIGNACVAVPWIGDDGFSSADACAKTAATLQDAAERLLPYGITTGYHNHAQEYKAKLEGGSGMELVIRDAPAVFYQLDTGNALSGGGDIYGCFDRFPGRFETVHAKPYSKDGSFDTMYGADCDAHDWPKLIDLFKTKGGTKTIIIEYEFEGRYGDLQGVEIALNNLAKYL